MQISIWCIYIHIQTCTNIHSTITTYVCVIFVFMNIQRNMLVHVYPNKCIQICIYTYTCSFASMYVICVYMYTHVNLDAYMHICINSYMYASIHSWIYKLHMYVCNVYLWIYNRHVCTGMSVYIHVYLYAYVHTHVCMHYNYDYNYFIYIGLVKTDKVIS